MILFEITLLPVRITIFAGLIALLVFDVHIRMEKTLKGHSKTQRDVEQQRKVAGQGIPNHCHKKNFVFLKTHKTGSSTIFNILMRRANKMGLSVTCIDKLIWPQYFKSDYLTLSSKPYNVFSYHSRFDKNKLLKLFPRNESFYFTILREPLSQWVSLYCYFRLYRYFECKELECLINFIKSNTYSQCKTVDLTVALHNMIKNPNLFDLGFPNVYENDLTKIKNYLKELEEDLDLIMYVEDFNSSLLILKKMLCLDDEDILYLPMNQNIPADKNFLNFETEMKLKKSIYQMNRGDALLYNHFRPTFNKYAIMVRPQLGKLETQLNKMYQTCVKGRKEELAYISRNYLGYEIKDTLKEPQLSKCQDYARSELNYTIKFCGKHATNDL